jgi:8-oxo-dGTP pyrophosphatase MutT (NUDIX family)
MLRSLQRAGYRLAYPIISVTSTVTGLRLPAVKCLLEHRGEVLLVRHTYGNRGAWDLPGGFIGRGEAPRSAAQRELQEELGVAIDELRDHGALETRVLGRHEHIHFFSATIGSRAIDRNTVELAEVGWFSPQRLPRPLGRHVPEMLARWRGTSSISDYNPGSPAGD